MKAVQLDALDMQLIDLLGTDARISNRKIAAELGVTEGTVRGRIRRLQQDGLIAFTAIRGLEIADHSRLAFVRIQAEIEHVRRVAHEISLLPQVNAVLIMMGQFNILTMCMFGELDDLFHLEGPIDDRFQPALVVEPHCERDVRRSGCEGNRDHVLARAAAVALSPEHCP